jgi:low temperature requirement protein LtrA
VASTRSPARVPIRVPMVPRLKTESHRSASQLELLFDLTFVIAIARITLELAHSIADGHATDGIVPFLQVFFAIWWAWMNFTWFASAFDNDDVAFRLLAMVQMAGVLVLATGVSAAIDHGDFRGITVGYLIMRVGLVALWLRAAVDCPSSRTTALRYAGGITILEVAWVMRLVLAERGALSEGSLQAVFVTLVAAELAVPWWAERCEGSDSTSWHPHHIAERYGLFLIILLGESLAAASAGVSVAVDGGAASRDLVTVAASGFVLAMALWWLYFLDSAGDGLDQFRDRSFWWGYGHYGIFAALAALGAGLEVTAKRTAGDIAASPTTAGYAVAIPVAVFLVVLASVNGLIIPQPAVRTGAAASTAAIVLVLPLASTSIGSARVVAAIAVVSVVLAAVSGTSRGTSTDSKDPRWGDAER